MSGAVNSEAAAMDDLRPALAHDFRDPGLLVQALTHSSVAGTDRAGAKRAPDYERLEFLGDRALGLAVADWLLELFPEEREGPLAKRFAGHVRREALAEVARRLDLGRYLRLSPGEEQMGGRDNDTILADACEAVIGALFLDGGFDAARRFVRTYWGARIREAGGPPAEAKTALQEWAQGRGLPLPAYTLAERSGPDHAPRFVVRVAVKGHGAAEGAGSGKRAAEQAAAAALMKKLEGKSGD